MVASDYRTSTALEMDAYLSSREKQLQQAAPSSVDHVRWHDPVLDLLTSAGANVHGMSTAARWNSRTVRWQYPLLSTIATRLLSPPPSVACVSQALQRVAAIHSGTLAAMDDGPSVTPPPERVTIIMIIIFLIIMTMMPQLLALPLCSLHVCVGPGALEDFVRVACSAMVANDTLV